MAARRARSRLAVEVLDDLALLDDLADASRVGEDGDVRQGVAVDDDEIGLLALLDGANLVSEAE
jgi:hypothetical protein